jgi:hypothetical protein
LNSAVGCDKDAYEIRERSNTLQPRR